MGKQWKQWQTLYSGSKITADSDCIHEIKRCLLLRRKAVTNSFRPCIKKQRYHFADRSPYSQSSGFSSSHVLMWQLNYREGWVPKNCCFQIVVLEKTLESPLDCKEIKPVNPKGNQLWIFIGRTDAETEASKLWLPDVKSWLSGKDEWVSLMLGKIESRGRKGKQRVRWLDGITDSMDEFEQALGDGEGQGSLACCSP